MVVILFRLQLVYVYGFDSEISVRASVRWWFWRAAALVLSSITHSGFIFSWLLAPNLVSFFFFPRKSRYCYYFAGVLFFFSRIYNTFVSVFSLSGCVRFFRGSDFIACFICSAMRLDWQKTLAVKHVRAPWLIAKRLCEWICIPPRSDSYIDYSVSFDKSTMRAVKVPETCSGTNQTVQLFGIQNAVRWNLLSLNLALSLWSFDCTHAVV